MLFRSEELYRRSPRDAARVRTAEQIETKLIELNEAAKPNGERVAAWQQVGPEQWRLDRPPHRVARDRRGRIVPHFDEQFEKLIATAKKIAPHEDAAAFALRVLNVDRRAIREESLQIDIVHRGDVWVTSLKNGKGVARDIGSSASLAEAIAIAQSRLVGNDAPFARQDKRRNQRRWRGRRRRPAAAAS